MVCMCGKNKWHQAVSFLRLDQSTQILLLHPIFSQIDLFYPVNVVNVHSVFARDVSRLPACMK